ncbi:MAG: hypothetical protein ACOX2I_10360 [Candidatus Ozemobacteraceae bacterium]
MYALTGNKWKNRYLDYWLGEGCVRIEVAAMANVVAAGDLYFKRSFNIRSLWEYIKEIGIRAVFNKVVSRFAERFRNDKVLFNRPGASCGRGKRRSFVQRR